MILGIVSPVSYYTFNIHEATLPTHSHHRSDLCNWLDADTADRVKACRLTRASRLTSQERSQTLPFVRTPSPAWDDDDSRRYPIAVQAPSRSAHRWPRPRQRVSSPALSHQPPAISHQRTSHCAAQTIACASTISPASGGVQLSRLLVQLCSIGHACRELPELPTSPPLTAPRLLRLICGAMLSKRANYRRVPCVNSLFCEPCQTGLRIRRTAHHAAPL